MAPPRRGPGRSFRKVPPKGKKPLKRLPYKKPFEPYVYGSLLDEGAFEEFIGDVTLANVPPKVYENLVKSINSNLSARYRSDILRGKGIDVETTEKEIQDLPGSSGAGVSTNVKDWLDDPEKQLSKTTESWWKSVFSWEDLAANAEINYFWKPLVTGDNKSLKYTDSAGTHSLNLVDQDDITGKLTGAGGPLSVDLGSVKTPDFYKKIASDVEQWGAVRGSRSVRIDKYNNLQVDMLTAIDARVSQVQLDYLKTHGSARVQEFANNWQELRDKVLKVETLTDPIKLTPETRPSIPGVAGTGGEVKGRVWDNLSEQGTSVSDAFKGVIKDQKIGGKIISAETISGLGIIAAPYLPPPLAVVSAAVGTGLSPEARKIYLVGQSLEARKRELLGVVDRSWHETIAHGEDLFSEINTTLGATVLSDLEARCLLTWERLINYRETQSTAHDFLEALDSKDFFRMFIWSGRMTKYIPGLSSYAQYLSPGDYVKVAMGKVNNFGLTGTFDEVSKKWEPFAKLAKKIEDSPALTSAANVLSLGLLEKENFAYVNVKQSWNAATKIWEVSTFKVTHSDLSFITGVAGVVDPKTGLAIATDWRMLDILSSAQNGLTVAEINELLDLTGTVSNARKEALVLSAASRVSTIGNEAAKALKNIPDVPAAIAHLRDQVLNNPATRAYLIRVGVIDPAGLVNEDAFRAFLSDVVNARLNNKYIGFVTSAGKKLDHVQSVLFEKLYKLVPGVKGPIQFLRGAWIKEATLHPQEWAVLAKGGLSRFGSRIVGRLGGSRAAFLLKRLGSQLLRLLGLGIDSLANVLPVIGPIVAAVFTWLVGKVFGKVWNAIKGPVGSVAKSVWKYSPLHWAAFTDYGFLSTGEDLKVVGCGCCLGGCVLFLLLPVLAVSVIGGAQYKFKNDLYNPSYNPAIKIDKQVTPASVGVGGGNVTYAIHVKNEDSASTLAAVTVTDNYQQSQGVTINCDKVPTSDSGGILVWNVNALAPGEMWTTTCTAAVDTGGLDKFITNLVEVSGNLAGTTTTSIATATLRVGNPAVTAPCGWPGGGVGTVTAACDWHRAHENGLVAIDLVYGLGTPLYSLLDGTLTRCVISTNVTSTLNYGVFVKIVGSGYEVRYAHLRPLPGEYDGQGCYDTHPVSVGDLVGEVGRTGFITGPHLHYEVSKAGVLTCPDCYLHSLAVECGGPGC